jgi:hypothetical protein
MTGSRKPHLRLVSIDGNPTEEETSALQHALESMTEHDREVRRASMWLRAGRAQGRRLGNLDYVNRFSTEDAWRLSTRFPFGGREYPGLNGRGDAK